MLTFQQLVVILLIIIILLQLVSLYKSIKYYDGVLYRLMEIIKKENALYGTLNGFVTGCDKFFSKVDGELQTIKQNVNVRKSKIR